MRSFWILILPLPLTSCDGPERAQAAAASSSQKGIVVMNAAQKEFSFSATYHKQNAVDGTWHLIVERRGDMAAKAIFTTEVSPGKFYEALKAIGAADANNVSPSNFSNEDIATQGDEIEFRFDWKSQKEPVPLAGLLKEVVPNIPSSGGARGIEMRFGGNYSGDDAASPPCHASGCLACLYSCSAGVTSNAKTNNALLKREKGVYRYRVDPGIEIEDNTRVRVYVRKK